MKIKLVIVLILGGFLTACGGGSDLINDVEEVINDVNKELGNGEEEEVGFESHNIKFKDMSLKYGIAVPNGDGYEIRFADQDNIGFYNYCQDEIEPSGYWTYYKEIKAGVVFKIDQDRSKTFIFGQGYVYELGERGYSRSGVGVGTYKVFEETDTKIMGEIQTENLSGQFLAYKCTQEATNKRLREFKWALNSRFDLKSTYNSRTQGYVNFRVSGPSLSDKSQIEIDLEHLERPGLVENPHHFYDSVRYLGGLNGAYLLGESLYYGGRTPIGSMNDNSIKYSIRDDEGTYEKGIGVFELEYKDGVSKVKFLYNNVGSDKFVISR